MNAAAEALQPSPETTREVATWVTPVARLGFVAKGIVYLMLGWFAVRAALLADEPLDRSEALAQLRDKDFGDVVLIAIAVGLVAHVLWRLTQALLDPEHANDRKLHLGARLAHLGSTVFYGALAWTAAKLALGAHQSHDGEDHWMAVLLSQPYGRLLAYGVAASIVAYGLRQFWRAWKGDPVVKHLALATVRGRKLVEAIGRFGVFARGVVFVLIGGFVYDAAHDFDASAAGSTDEALRALGHGWLVGIVAAGFIAYGLFQFFEARYHRIHPWQRP
ncbi:MAG TPA: DUF1206 domain-containing protein [Xanthomonadales bacterium]|nr:DUF1206 domain-containing protein [Xanthomonadales bacterium]